MTVSSLIVGLTQHVQSADFRAAEGFRAGHFKGLDRRGDGELHWSSVDDTDYATVSGRLDNGKEGLVDTVLRVEVQQLLVVVGSLHDLNLTVQGAAIGLQKNGGTANLGIEVVRTHGSSLDRLATVLSADFEGLVTNAFVIGSDNRLQGELEHTGITDGNGVGTLDSIEESTECALGTIFDIGSHLDGCVVGTMPELNIGFQRTALSLHQHVNTLNVGVAERPSEKRTALDGSSLAGLPDAPDALGSLSQIRVVL